MVPIIVSAAARCILVETERCGPRAVRLVADLGDQPALGFIMVRADPFGDRVLQGRFIEPHEHSRIAHGRRAQRG
jgi:hypothetical protein